MKKTVTFCMLWVCFILCTPAWAYLDAGVLHHPAPRLTSAALTIPRASYYLGGPAEKSRAAYVAASRSAVTFALQNYLDRPGPVTYREVADAVADYEAFSY
jgi:hypothetical protein